MSSFRLGILTMGIIWIFTYIRPFGTSTAGIIASFVVTVIIVAAGEALAETIHRDEPSTKTRGRP